jgi:chorismate synthase
MLRFLTAGESHGPSLTAILDGVPAGTSPRPDIITLNWPAAKKDTVPADA